MKKMRKLLSLVLVAVMLTAMAVPAMAKIDNSVVCPQIYVPGVASTAVYADESDPSTVLDIPDKDGLTTLLAGDILPAFIAYAADNDAEKLGYSLSAALNKAFDVWFNNPDGTAKGNAGAGFVYPDKKNISSSSTLRFSYDWRGDPLEIAADLNDYVDYVIEATGCEKVALTSHSFGAVVILTYLTVYGSDKVMGIVLDTPAINGLTSVGELFSGNTTFCEAGIEALLKMVMGSTEYAELSASIVDILTMAGINGSVSDFLNDAYDNIGAILMEETLFPLFGTWLSIWAMIPDEYIDDVMTYSFDSGVYDEDYSVLKTKVQAYNDTVRKYKKQTLLDFDKEGRVAVISRYGYNAVPVSQEWTMLSDNVIETANSSLGATTAAIGEVLSEEYLADKDMKYISPDKTVDASTCLFPEKTWFIKGASHEITSATIPLHKELLFAVEESTCDNSDIARFMLYNKADGKLELDESQPVVAEKLTMFDRIFNFIKALINKIIDIFKK